MRPTHRPRRALAAIAIAVLITLPGCVSYVTPGGPAALTRLARVDAHGTPDSIAERLNRRPAAEFPASVAIARLQGQGYRSYTAESYGRGDYTLVTVREAERPEHFERLAKLPMLRGVAPLNRFVVSGDIRSDREVREAAAQVQADMVLLYTFDTRFGSRTAVPALGTITLGIFPSEEQKVTATASAVLMDTRTGYVYGLAEHTGASERLSNAWNTRQAADRARLEAEAEAFDGLVTEIERMWLGVVQQHAAAPG